MHDSHTRSEENGNYKTDQHSSIIQDVTFSSFPTKLKLMSKQMQVEHISSGHLDPKMVLEAYKLSYRQFNCFQKYLQFELKRFSTAKIFLKLALEEYQSCQKKACLSAKQLSLIVFLLNTLHYMSLEEMIRRFRLTCNQHNMQSKIEKGQFVLLFAQILPFHFQKLEAIRKLYLQKYTRLINIYKQSQKQKANQLIKSITSFDKDIATTKLVLISIADNMPISETELITLLKTILKAKKRVIQLQYIADNRQLRVLFLLGKLFELESKEKPQKFVNQAYLRQFRNNSMKASPQQIMQYLLSNH